MAGVELAGQQIAGCVCVNLVFHSRQHALGYAQALTAYRIAEHRHLVAQIRQVADGQGLQVGVELFFVHRDEGQVGFVGHEQHARLEAFWIIMLLRLNIAGIGNNVRVGEDAVGVDQRAGAGSLARIQQPPGDEVVGRRLGRINLDYRIFDFPDVGILCGNTAAGERQRDENSAEKRCARSYSP